LTGKLTGRLHLLALEADFFKHRVLGRLQQSVEPAQDDHRQDDVAVLAADVDIAKAVVGDGPDEGDELVVCCVVHVWRVPLIAPKALALLLKRTIVHCSLSRDHLTPASAAAQCGWQPPSQDHRS
jgi:hypothetical protein